VIQHKMRRALVLLLKAAVSVALLYVSLRAVHLDTVAARLAGAKAAWLLAAAALMIVQLVLAALRWREIVDAAPAGAVRLPLPTALRFNLIGTFFSQVLPSTVGGDAARIVLLARHAGDWAAATYSVLIDRIVGVAMLAAIVVACLPWTLSIVHDPLARSVLLVIGFGALAAAALFLALGLLPVRYAARVAPLRHLVAAARMAWTLCRCPGSSSVLAATSLPIHLITVAMVWCCARSVGAPVGFAQVLYLLPPVLLVATVPVSIAGWGVRESSMVVAFGYAGLAPGDGLILSILFGLVSFAVGTLGGAVWVASGVKRLPFTAAKTLPLAGESRS